MGSSRPRSLTLTAPPLVGDGGATTDDAATGFELPSAAVRCLAVRRYYAWRRLPRSCGISPAAQSLETPPCGGISSEELVILSPTLVDACSSSRDRGRRRIGRVVVGRLAKVRSLDEAKTFGIIPTAEPTASVA